jgi:tetratricopeptide (TPR) repeat protein
MESCIMLQRGFLGVAAFFFGLVILFHSPAFGDAPIPCGKDAYTAAQFDKELDEYRLGLVGEYDKQTKDEAAIRGKIKEILMGAMGRLQGDPASPNWNELEEKFAPELSVSQDPLFLAVCGVAKKELGKHDEAKALLLKSQESFAGSTYSANWKFFCAEQMRSLLQIQNAPPEEMKKCEKEFVRAVVETMTQTPENSKQRRFIWAWSHKYVSINTQDAQGFKLLSAIHAEVQKNEKVDAWMRNMVAGCYYRNYGWKIRGSGYAFTVGEDAMKKFQENITKSGESFGKAWEADPKLPEVPGAMVSVSMAGGDPDHSPRDWFDRTVALQMDYMPAYSSLSWSLRPRGGGTHDDIFRLANDCAATKRYDTGVPERYMEDLLSLDSETGEQGEVWREEGVYETVKQIAEGVANEPSRKVKKKLNSVEFVLSAYVFIAILTNHYDDARATLDKLGDQFRTQLINNFHLRYPRDIARVYALTGNARAETGEFEEAIADNAYREPDALKSARALLDKAVAKDQEPKAKPYYDYWQTRLAWQDGFNKGEWVDLTFANDMTTWEMVRGGWHPEDDRTVVGDVPDGHRTCHLRCAVPFGAPFEMECEAEAIEGDSEMHAGIMVGNIWYEWQEEPGRLFGVKFAKKHAFVCSRNTFWFSQLSMAEERKCRLRLRFWPTYFELFVDGQFVEKSDYRELPDGEYFGLGIMGGKARFRNPRIRKIGYEPPPDGDHAARLAYFEEAVRRDPKDAYAYKQRGEEHEALGHSEESGKDYQKAVELDPNWPAPIVRLGQYEFSQGRFEKCLELCDRHNKLIDVNPETYSMMAAIQASAPDDKLRDGKAAVENARKACKYSANKWSEAFEVLSCAQAESGEFDEAVKSAKKAEELATNPPLKARCRKKVELFESRKPYRLGATPAELERD